MIRRPDPRRGLLSMAYLATSHLLPLLAPTVLRKRRRRGKEHPTRWPEKQARALAPRPDGTLIWLNAVGLGEVLSLRGLIVRLAAKRPDLSFLVTSSTRGSAEVFAKNLPPNTIHQFLPIDAPRYRARFLDHFRPDLCIWAEQDIWPGFVHALAHRHIPQAMVGARMNAASFASHKKAQGLYSDIYAAMAMITAQDTATAAYLTQLGARNVRTTGSLKPSAPPLAYDPTALAALQTTLGGRTIWAVAPSHPQDETIAIAAHQLIRQTDPSALLIIVPRYPERGDDIARACPIAVKRKSLGETPDFDSAIWLCDSFGDLGLVYRLAHAVLIGGTFCDIEGHSPWEAAILQTAILHGPRTANFTTDFETLQQANAAVQITDADHLAKVLLSKPTTIAPNASTVVATAAKNTDQLVNDLFTVLDATYD